MVSNSHRPFSPTTLLRLDVAGAVLSTVLLAFILPRHADLLGLPAGMFGLLAMIPAVYLVIDCYGLSGDATRQFRVVRLMGYLNWAYSLLVTALGLYHHETLTQLGLAYVLIDMLVVATVGMVELRATRE